MRRILLLLALVGICLSLLPPTFSGERWLGEIKITEQLASIPDWIHTSLRPQPNLAPEAVNTAGIPYYGINAFPNLEPSKDVRDRIFNEMQLAGIQVARQQFDWEDIEIHGKGNFVDRRRTDITGEDGISSWAKYDNIVELAEKHEIQLLARLDNPPTWSRANQEDSSLAPPDNFNDYGDFVATVAERYKGRIKYYQIWNEPNGNEEWGEKGAQPEQFTQLLCIAYQRIKAVDENAVIVAPALSPIRLNDQLQMNDLIFLQRMYNAGAESCFDIASAQGYGLNFGAYDRRLQPTIYNAQHHLLVRDVMVANGDAEKPIWISEAGWNYATEADVGGAYQNFLPMSEDRAATENVNLYARTQAEWPWISSINQWFLKRPTEELSQPSYYFRLMEPDFKPRLSWKRLTEYTLANQPIEQEPLPRGTDTTVWKARPIFLRISLAIFFFTLLQGLLQPSEKPLHNADKRWLKYK